MTAAPAPRGGRQQIPRPPGWRNGGPPPWATLPPELRTIGVDDIQRVVRPLGAGQPSPAELDGALPSAVLAPFYEEDGRLMVVLTRRAWHLRSHRGEVSFPGGARDGDESLVDTALRESWEEVRLDASAVTVIGELDHLNTVRADRYIVPFVGLLAERPELEPEPDEVEEILHVAVDDLLEEETFREERWMFDGAVRPITFFEIPGDTIWGATASILRRLFDHALDVPDPALETNFSR